jgi:hypothetical protein
MTITQMANNSEEFIAYLTHLRAEHRRLQQCLRRIEQQWIDCEVPRLAEIIPQVIEDLEILRAELADHFEEEESGGCLEEAVSRQPSLSHEAIRLEHEHPVMLEQVDLLIVKLKEVSGPIQSADEAKEDFRRFAEQLHAHEAAENRILEESFGIEVE